MKQGNKYIEAGVLNRVSTVFCLYKGCCEFSDSIVGYRTALAAIYKGWEKGSINSVFYRI